MITDTVDVTFEGLSTIAARLSEASSAMGAAGADAPAAPASGAGAPQAATLTSHLLDQLAHLCLALESASEALAGTRDSYESVDRDIACRTADLLAAM